MKSILESDEIELAKIMSNLHEFSWLNGADPVKIRHEINTKIANALREYYFENTRMTGTKWTAKFRQANISEDDGKVAISCARRLGIEIS
jgi:hypothetical protein